jgi:hypothetical protein
MKKPTAYAVGTDSQTKYYLTARVTLPSRRQRVQTCTRRGEPSTIAATRFTFGFHIRLLRLWEWLTLIPKETPLSQYEHFAICCYLQVFLLNNATHHNRRKSKMQEKIQKQ